MIDFNKDKAYMEVLNTFRKLMNTEYKEGGWLPPVREMCKRLNVSNVTYTKATKRLVSETMARSFPGKGIYIVPQKYRPKKIGLVVGNGEESPFLYDVRVLHSIFGTLDERGYCCHLIQGNSALNVARSAISHCASGVIWITSPSPNFQGIKDIYENKLFPLVCIPTQTPSCTAEQFPEEIPLVSEDHSRSGEILIKPFLERGHKKIASVGQSIWHAELNNTVKTMRDAGLDFDENYCITNYPQTQGEVARVIKNLGVTGLIIHGNTRTIESAFKEIIALPKEQQPEVLLRDDKMLTEIRKKFPKVKIIAVFEDVPQKYAKAATEMLLDNLDTPEKITSLKIPTLQVNHTNK